MIVSDNRLHGRYIADVIRTVGSVVHKTKQLPNPHLQGAPLTYEALELFQVTCHGASRFVVFVHEAPSVVDEPAVDAVAVRLTLIDSDVSPEPLHLGESTGSIVSEDAAVRLLHLLPVVDIPVMMAHQPGEVFAGSGVRLLEVDRLLVLPRGHVHP